MGLNSRKEGNLSLKDSRFVDEYIACGGNAVVAYCRAYECENTAPNRAAASNKLRQDKIQTEIKRRTAPMIMSLKEEEQAIRKKLYSMIDGSDPTASNSDAIRAADVLNKMAARYLVRTTTEQQPDENLTQLTDEQIAAIISEKK
jgi:hypothetical protein